LKSIELFLQNKINFDQIYKCLNVKFDKIESSTKVVTRNYNSSSSVITTILSNEQWSCASCTYLNEPNSTYCSLCHTAKNLPNATFL
jgi:hypothetical protein